MISLGSTPRSAFSLPAALRHLLMVDSLLAPHNYLSPHSPDCTTVLEEVAKLSTSLTLSGVKTGARQQDCVANIQ